MEEGCVACVCQGVTSSVSQGSVRERGRGSRWAWEGWMGEVRGKACLGEEKSEYVCVGGWGVRFMAWVEVFTARTQGGHQADLQD